MPAVLTAPLLRQVEGPPDPGHPPARPPRDPRADRRHPARRGLRRLVHPRRQLPDHRHRHDEERRLRAGAGPARRGDRGLRRGAGGPLRRGVSPRPLGHRRARRAPLAADRGRRPRPPPRLRRRGRREAHGDRHPGARRARGSSRGWMACWSSRPPGRASRASSATATRPSRRRPTGSSPPRSGPAGPTPRGPSSTGTRRMPGSDGPCWRRSPRTTAWPSSRPCTPWARRRLDACAEIEEITLTLPNQHRILVDLERFGQANANEIFVATDEPFGLITGTLRRRLSRLDRAHGHARLGRTPAGPGSPPGPRRPGRSARATSIPRAGGCTRPGWG